MGGDVERLGMTLRGGGVGGGIVMSLMDAATTAVYTLCLQGALPVYVQRLRMTLRAMGVGCELVKSTMPV